MSVCLLALQSGPWIPPEGSRICQNLSDLSWWSLGDPWYLETPAGMISAQRGSHAVERAGDEKSGYNNKNSRHSQRILLELSEVVLSSYCMYASNLPRRHPYQPPHTQMANG